MKGIRTFWSNRSIATKVTLCCGLFLFCAAYTLFYLFWTDAASRKTDRAISIYNYYLDQIEEGIESAGYAAYYSVSSLPGKTAAPAYGTEGYAALKMLLVDGISDDNPCALAYYDENAQFVSILSPVFLYTTGGSEAAGNTVRILVDIGGLSVDE